MPDASWHSSPVKTHGLPVTSRGRDSMRKIKAFSLGTWPSGPKCELFFTTRQKSAEAISLCTCTWANGTNELSVPNSFSSNIVAFQKNRAMQLLKSE